MIEFAFSRINWSACEHVLLVHCLPCKAHSLVGGILGALFCVSVMIFFFFFNQDKKSLAMLIFLITQDCPPGESTHNELFFSHSFRPSVCLSLTFPPVSSLFLFLCHTLQWVFEAFIPLAKIGKEHCSNQARWTQIRTAHWKIFHWRVEIWMKSKAEMFFFLSNYRLDHKPYCFWVISLITVWEFIILFFLIWDSSSISLIYMLKWPTAGNHRPTTSSPTNPPTLKGPCGVLL